MIRVEEIAIREEREREMVWFGCRIMLKEISNLGEALPISLDVVLVPSGLLLMAVYHAWLLATIIRRPKRTIIGLNAMAKKRWVYSMMSDPVKNGVLAVQTIRNNIMASTVLATATITLSSLISVFVEFSSSKSSSSRSNGDGVGTPTSSDLAAIKFYSIAFCFIVAFFCHVQSIRFYAHASFLITIIPVSGSGGSGNGISVAYASRTLNRGSFFWSLGLRAIYVSFTLFVWILGPVSMVLCSAAMCCLLYFLDSAVEPNGDMRDFFSGHDDNQFLQV